jgi:hypothetical protein
MSGRIAENEIALRFRLRLYPHGAGGDCPPLGAIEIINLEINVPLPAIGR